MKKTLIIVVLMAFPLVTSAVWWNPLTWGQQATVVQYESPAPSTPTEPEVVIEERVVEVPVEKIVEKVVERTIKVDNPELQAKINSLLKENSDLKAQIASKVSVTEQLNSCKADLIGAQSKVTASAKASIPTTPMTVKLDGVFCTAKEPNLVKVPMTIEGGWWQYGELVLSKNLANPNSWSSQDSITTVSIWPGIKELRLANRDGTYPITINLYHEVPVNGEVKQDSLISSFSKQIFIPKGLPCL